MKAKDVARWFLLRNYTEEQHNDEFEPITNLKLQKLLYYAQGVYLAINNKPLFDENILAWEHGPVVREVYNQYRANGKSSIKYIAEANDFNICKSIECDQGKADVLEFVFEEFGQYTAWALRNKTHKERPWLKTKQNDIIKQELIRDYFLEEVIEV